MRELFLPGQPLSALASYRQFINWRLVPVEGGKPKKVPLQPVDDPSKWLSWYEACTYDEEHVGFVFTAQDPFVFVDLDNQWDTETGAWSEFAQRIYGMFPGAYFEVSFGRTGFHLICRADALPPDHPCKRAATHAGLEIYSHGRYAAITGVNADGDANTNCAAGAQQLIAELSEASPGPSAQTPFEWTDGPQEGALAATMDDQELLEKMKSHVSPNYFSGRATFPVLWNADPEILGTAFPHPEKPYDASAADMSLCAALAFWTGKDCERMDRLFRMSGLYRDKWERDDYRTATILRACAEQRNIYTGRSEKTQGPVGGVPSGSMLLTHELPDFFAGCVYISDIHRIMLPDGRLLDAKQFKDWKGGFQFQLTGAGKMTKDAWEAFTQNEVVRFPKAVTRCFRPDLKPGQIVDGAVNTYVPPEIRRVAGDPSPFLDHLKRMVPDDRDRSIILYYMASLVQNPGHKFQWCLVVQGTEGNGKSMLIQILKYCVGGDRYSYEPRSKTLGSQFNSWVVGKVFVGVNEFYSPHHPEIILNLLELVTGERLETEGKGANQAMADNRANLVMCTNFKDAIRKSRNDRRYAIFFTAQQCRQDLLAAGMTEAYFARLWAWLRADGYAILADYLLSLKIPAEMDPAVGAVWAPETTSTHEARYMSMSLPEQIVREAIENEDIGFRDGWVSSVHLANLFKSKSHKASPNLMRMILEDLGYVPHPRLQDGRASQRLVCDQGKRSTLYVAMSRSDLIMVENPTEVYKAAQGFGEPATVHVISNENTG